MAFTYRARSAETWDKKSNQSSNDFETFIREEFKFFKPKKGNNCIRILPPTFDDADHYGITVHVHYSVGPKFASVLCPENMGKGKCPLCEARARALKLGEEEEAKELKSSKRTLAWLVDNNDTDMGPLLWAMPIQCDANICKISKDRKTGEIYPIDHPDEGYDVYFDVTGEKITTKYDGYQLDRRPSEVKQKFIDFVEDHPLPETLIWRDYDEIKALYEGGAAEPGPEEKTVTRRRSSNGHDNAEPTGRRAAPEDDAPKGREPETSRRRVEASETRGRRDEINDEIPFTGGRVIESKAEEEKEAEPLTAASRLRERYKR